MNIDLEDIAADERFERRRQARDAGQPWFAIEPEADDAVEHDQVTANDLRGRAKVLKAIEGRLS